MGAFMEEVVCKQVDELRPGFKLVVRIWWLMLWRGVLGAFAISFVAGFALGFVAAITHFAPMDQVKLYGQILGAVIGVIWSLFVTLMALMKKYKGFRIALIRED